MPKSHFPRRLLLFLAAGAVLFILWLIQAGIGAGSRAAEASNQREQESLQDLASKLEAMKSQDAAPRVAVMLSQKFIHSILQQFKGGMMVVPPSGSLPEIRFKFGEIASTFKIGFPKIAVAFDEMIVGSTTGHNLKVEGVLEPIVEDGKARLRVTITHFETATLNALPATVRAAILGHALQRLNDHIPVIDIPIQSTLNMPSVSVAQIPVTVPVPGGSITLALAPPEIPALSRHLLFQAIFFNTNNLVVIADLFKQAPAEQTLPKAATIVAKISQASLKVAREKVAALLNATPWQSMLASVKEDFHVWINPALIQELVAEAGLWPTGNRTLTVHSTGSTGDILAKTGGLPFGNGFKISLEHPDSVQGSAMLIKPELKTAADVYELQGDIALAAKVQIHAHGNPPHIEKKIFGVKIINVKLGGGVGTNIGLTLEKPHQVSATLSVKSSTKEEHAGLGMTLKSPPEIRVSIDGGGIPGWVEKHFMSNIQVPLPAGSELAWVPLPKLLAPSIRHPLKPGVTLRLESVPAVELQPDGIHVTGSLKVSESP